MPAASTPAAVSDAVADLMPSDEDLLYEEEILRNPFSLRMWLRYIEARKDAPDKRRFLLFERAISKLPGSYKLWHRYLNERTAAVRSLPPGHMARDALHNTFERALATMHKMPRIWLEYIDSLVNEGFVTRTRRTLDRALAALPVTQHDRLWQVYLSFVTRPGMPKDTAFRVYRRYLKMEPGHREEYVEYLRSKAQWGQAASQLADLVNDDSFRSLEGKSKHHLWLELCDIITKHPDEVRDLNIDAIIRAGIRKFPTEVGRLWCALADFYIRQGMFERARDVYQEGVEAVVTVRDFTLVFEALTKFEQALADAQLEELGDDDDDAMDTGGAGAGEEGEDFLLKDDGVDIDLRIRRLEWLLSRRPQLLSNVMLRQNPHNVQEWHKRVKLFDGDAARQIRTYTEAVTSVDPEQAVGKPHSLWCAFAHFYERHGDLANARIVFEKATQAKFMYADDLSHVWCQWAEMEVKHANYRRAIDLLARAVRAPPSANQRLTADQLKALPPQAKLYRSTRVWSMYVDLVEALGTFEEARAVYDEMISLRVASAQVVLNYADFLQQRKYWEDAFKVYEKGVALFKYPHVEPIWAAYLTSFVDRHKGGKLERARDLFTQACEEAPPAKRKQFYSMWADFEERHGLARHCFAVYERAAAAVPKKERAEVYRLFVAKAKALVGIPKVREVYMAACEAEPPAELPDADVLTLALEFAAVERDLQEIDRARAIYTFASHLADDRLAPHFWTQWEAFEGRHGNANTWREMTRIHRSVAASFSSVHFNTTNVEASVPVATGGADVDPSDPMAALEAQVANAGGEGVGGFVSAGVQGGSAAAAAEAVAAAPANPEELDIGDDDDDE